MISRATKRLSTVAAGLLCLTVSSMTAAPAQAQTNQYAEDWAKLQKVLGFASNAYGYVNGAISAITWLTGSGGAPTGPSLDEIKQVVVDAMRGQQTEDIINRVNSVMSTLREIQNEATSHAQYMGNPDDLMRSQWAVNFLSARLANIKQDASYVHATLETILRREAQSRGDGFSREKQAVAVLPAFMTLVPLRVATMKMVGEIHPSLAAGEAQNISDLLASAGVTYFRLVGTYSIRYTYCPGGPFCAISRSPVGLDQGQMWRRQLYSYYHRLSNGNLNTYPAMRFTQYQSIPLVWSALKTLGDIDWTYRLRNGDRKFTFSERKVWIMDQYTDPNDFNRTSPRFTDVTDGVVWHVWACDANQIQFMCPKIEGQGN